MQCRELIAISEDSKNTQKVIEYARSLGVACRAIDVELDDATSEIELAISIIFSRIGVSANLKGYSYLKIAVMLVLENPDLLQRKVTSGLYPTVAGMFSTNAICVEHSIRHAISSTWNNGNFMVLNDVFGNCVSMKTGKPTNSEFIAKVVELIRTKQMI